MNTDPSGKQKCWNSCQWYLDEMVRLINILHKRFMDMLEDTCWQFEIWTYKDLKEAIYPRCRKTNTKTTWGSHQAEYYSTRDGGEGDGGLRDAVKCYETKGDITPQQQGHVNPNTNERCNRSNENYQKALAWRNLPAPEKNRRNGATDVPPLNLYLIH